MMILKGRSMKRNADIGVIGMAVMGQNLVLNMNDRGYSIAVYNRTTERMKDFVDGPARGRQDIFGAEELENFVRLLKPPRKIMLMVKAGEVVDIYIDKLTPLLENGDIIIDGGNSRFPDTERRKEELKKHGLRFVGMGVSGGEAGARSGPSLMPGGNPEAWPHIEKIFRDIAAKTEEGDPCCTWLGPGGAGHYVKMVHNGIEYGDIQVISEGYHLLKTAGFSHDDMAGIFSDWNRGELESYLIEITADILRKKDTDGEPLVEKILDTAGQKGTGKWTSVNSMDLAVPVTLIAEAVFSRFLSAMKDERVEAARQLGEARSGGGGGAEQPGGGFIEKVRLSMLASKIVSYTQGFMLLRRGSEEYGWELDYGGIADLWREGCIIRSVFLKKIKHAFDSEPGLVNLLLDGYFKKLIGSCDKSWRETVSRAVMQGVPVPALSSALAFFDGYRNERLPANLLQAARDYFGAHTYERVDRPRGRFYHADWTGEGGETLSDTYNA
jgi:6-phosphogluconate dehydrogenase